MFTLTSTAIREEETLESIANRADVWLAYIQNLEGDVSTEGFGIATLKALAGLTDLFGRLAMTLKTNVFRFYKNTKRSEMKFYSDSHLASIRIIEGLSYDKVMNLDIPVPSGMLCTYAKGCTAVTAVYNSLDMVNTAKMLYKACTDIYRMMSLNDPAYQKALDNVFRLMESRKKGITASIDVANKCFTQQRTGEVKFSKAYASMKEFKDVRLSLLDMEGRLQSVGDLIALIEDTDGVLDNVTSYVTENEGAVSAAFLERLANTIKTLAWFYESYGNNATRQMGLEHNHILVMDKVYSSYK